MQTLYNPQSGYLKAPYQQAADRLNAAIERYNEENPGEIVIVDVGAVLADDAANFASDDIHPSVAGNEKIAQAILDKLYELDLGESTQPIIAVEGQDIQIPETFAAMFDVLGTVFHIVSVVYNFIISLLF